MNTFSPSSSFFCTVAFYTPKKTPTTIVGPHSPRSFFPDDDGVGAHHFLDSCHLCNKPLGVGRDIFMYRGDTPFCSEECRQEQIETDEANEKRDKMSKKKSDTVPSKSDNMHVTNAGTVVAG